MSGWAVFEDGKLIEYGKISLTDSDLGERLFKFRQEILNLINKFQIDELIFEDIQLQKDIGDNVKTFKILAEVFGNLYELATELNLPNSAVLADVWRSTLGIKGIHRQEQKKNAQNYVFKKYDVECTQDEADAICIGLHAIKIKEKEKSEKGFDWSF